MQTKRIRIWVEVPHNWNGEGNPSVYSYRPSSNDWSHIYTGEIEVPVPCPELALAGEVPVMELEATDAP